MPNLSNSSALSMACFVILFFAAKKHNIPVQNIEGQYHDHHDIGPVLGVQEVVIKSWEFHVVLQEIGLVFLALEIGMLIQHRHIVNNEAVGCYDQRNYEDRDADFPDTWEIAQFRGQLPVEGDH